MSLPRGSFVVDFEGEDKPHGSIINVFSAWNAMVGTGIVFTPWAYSECGIILGLFLTFVGYALSFTT
jgi:amino acid permease